MAKEINLELPNVDDLFKFSTNKGKAETVVMIPIEEISDFPNHPFKVRDDEKMIETVASIKKHGVIFPAIVRKKADGSYEMIAGHRRKRACQIAEINEMPCLVRELTDEEATILMVDTNVQREEILPSERAFAFKMKLDAIKKQGKRVDLTSTPVEEKLSVDIIAEEFGISREQVRRYVRLTELIPELLEMVDKEKGGMSLRPAVEISYMTKKDQKELLDVILLNEATPSEQQAKELRKLSEKGLLERDKIEEILSEEKPNQKEQIKFKVENVKNYFPKGYSVEQMQKVMQKLLEEYQIKWKRRMQEKEMIR
ncbi:MAG: ParB/RepB/Spo0J family partition protein [Clostridia bacterium]|jgi:hypothetical protein|nr:ParB/RepB/Spo0J family partition protein [Clostridiaceae bacterium]